MDGYPDSFQGSFLRTGVSPSRSILGAGSIAGNTLGHEGHADHVDKTGNGSEGDAGNGDPSLVEVLISPRANEPANYCCAGQHQRYLKKFFSLHDGFDAAGHLGARVGVLEWVMERHPSWLYTKDAEGRDDANDILTIGP